MTTIGSPRVTISVCSSWAPMLLGVRKCTASDRATPRENRKGLKEAPRRVLRGLRIVLVDPRCNSDIS
ncbi:MAG TPA: hypothetical protein VJN18_07955 [Polyangiaceae bacterium]|nr:hypothetical protein [Polyangiaceae bacterium]